jgi:putative Mg2+ transporter-C (MgtC) family protein
MSMTWDFILRLFVAGALGTVIGLDREYRAKEAGYRTHFLVSLGSALIMIVSQYGFMEVVKMEGIDLDPSRVAAQVVSGIGFIGAGTIIFQKQIVRGLLPLPEFGLLRASVWLLEPVCTGWESQQQSLR